ncbi:MAG TPA: zinc-binding dehydrogenase [Gemmatimonadales bacterium]|jgi:putative PIG3 family NAD(P)H quinone oxidoreductase
MHALTHPAPGALALVDRPAPSPGPGEILVAVHASGLNRADLHQRDGKYPAPAGWPAEIPGLEYAGEVDAVGAAVTRWRVGDRVMGLVGGGGHAGALVVPENEVLAVPDGLTFVAAAALPEAFLTAWDAIALQGSARPGSRVLMHAIGSGVGTAAVQLARVLGWNLVGTSRTADKLVRATTLGLQHGVLSTDHDWPGQVGGAIDVLVDPLGAEFFADNFALLAQQGRYIVLGTMTGRIGPPIDLGAMLSRRLQVIGTAMRSRSGVERSALVERFAAEVLPMFASGRLVPVIDSIFDITAAAAAYQRLEGNATFGKVILQHRAS